MAEHTLRAEPTHSIWNRAHVPRLRASGDTVHLECVDSSGAQVHPSMKMSEYLKSDRNLIHALTGPMIETAAGRTEPPGHGTGAGEWILVESSTGATAAARAASSRIIDLLVEKWGISKAQAYLLCSVAMNLRFSQVVNEPIFTVSAAISRQIFPDRKLF